MTLRSLFIFISALIFLIKTTTSSFAGPNTQRVIDSTNAFLNSLSAEQKKAVQFPYIQEKQATAAEFKDDMNEEVDFIGEQYGKLIWSNTPVGDVPRPGVQLKSLSALQQDYLMKLLQTFLSKKGFQKVLDIMGADQVLSEKGTPYLSGRAYYTVGVFGEPSMAKPWMIAFGGHHLALILTVVGDQGALTPMHTGALPALYQSAGKTIRPLGDESDKAFALLNALDKYQRQKAILSYQVSDLVLGPGHFGEKIKPEGLKCSELNEKQRALLLDLIGEWAGMLNDDYSQPHLQEIKAGLDDTYFAWSGPITHDDGKNGRAYFRIQGPKVIVEFSPQASGGDLTMHVHTMYRDPTNDYGRSFTHGK
jgi:Protein of unknown function (DUF3500)